MIKISINDAQTGMVTAEPIKTPLGQILAMPGTALFAAFTYNVKTNTGKG